MSKFEQLLDLIVNEEHDKANELFHEIVVEKSREIYENLIAEEEAATDVEETADDVEENVDDIEESDDVEEGADDIEESDDVEENADDVEENYDDEPEMEDAYSVEGDDEEGDGMDIGAPDQTDDLEGDVAGGDDKQQAIFDIKSALEELESALAQLGGDSGDGAADMGMGDELPGDEKSDEMMGMPAMEGRRMTREYREKVGNDWEKNSMKTQGQYVGAGTGDKEGSPVEGKSPIASGKNKPGPAGVGAGNLNQGHTEGQSNTGTSPGKVNHGITPTKGDKMASGLHNVDGKQSGVKTLSKQPGHGPEKKGSGPGPVGSGSGDKAGQTSMGNQQSLLKSYSK